MAEATKAKWPVQLHRQEEMILQACESIANDGP